MKNPMRWKKQIHNILKKIKENEYESEKDIAEDLEKLVEEINSIQDEEEELPDGDEYQ